MSAVAISSCQVLLAYCVKLIELLKYIFMKTIDKAQNKNLNSRENKGKKELCKPNCNPKDVITLYPGRFKCTKCDYEWSR